MPVSVKHRTTVLFVASCCHGTNFRIQIKRIARLLVKPERERGLREELNIEHYEMSTWLAFHRNFAWYLGTNLYLAQNGKHSALNSINFEQTMHMEQQL